MPSAPSNTFQLIAILVFLLPGIVFQFTRGQLRGPTPDDASVATRLLRALTASTALAIAYALILRNGLFALIRSASTQGVGAHGVAPVSLALWALVLLFVVPAGLALVDHWTRPFRARFRFLAYDPTPSAWDFSFAGRSPCYLRILLSDGRYVGGWYGLDSFVSSYPEPHELFLEKAHAIDSDGVMGGEIEGSAGIWVPCEKIVLLEILEPAIESPAPEVATLPVALGPDSSEHASPYSRPPRHYVVGLAVAAATVGIAVDLARRLRR